MVHCSKIILACALSCCVYQAAQSMELLPDPETVMADLQDLRLDNVDESDVDLITHIGYCYFHGTGLPQDFEKAYQYFVFAAKRGYDLAQFYLGHCFLKGLGVEKDLAIAMDCLWKAATKGSIEAQHYLGECFFYGCGVCKDAIRAFYWYSQAAAQGNANAQYMLGVYYHAGLHVVPQDLAQACTWYLLAAAQGHPQAQRNLVKIQRSVMETPVDMPELCNTIFSKTLWEE